MVDNHNGHIGKFVNHEDDITAIGYAISSALSYIFDEGGSLESFEDAWGTMEKNTSKADSILGSS